MTDTMSDSVRVPRVEDVERVRDNICAWLECDGCDEAGKWPLCRDIAERAVRAYEAAAPAPAADVTDETVERARDAFVAVLQERCSRTGVTGYFVFDADIRAALEAAALPRAADVREAVLVPITDTELRDVLVRALIKNGQQINASFLLSGDKIPVHVTDVYAAMRDIEELTIKSALASRPAMDEARLREILADTVQAHGSPRIADRIRKGQDDYIISPAEALAAMRAATGVGQ